MQILNIILNGNLLNLFVSHIYAYTNKVKEGKREKRGRNNMNTSSRWSSRPPRILVVCLHLQNKVTELGQNLCPAVEKIVKKNAVKNTAISTYFPSKILQNTTLFCAKIGPKQQQQQKQL